MPRTVLSFDAETDGLWGPVLAIGAVLYRGDEPVSIFKGRVAEMPAPGTGWVGDNVTPACEGMTVYERLLPPSPPIDFGCAGFGGSPEGIIREHRRADRSLLGDFAEWYLTHKPGADIVAHMPVPVEAGLLTEMRRAGLIGDWDGPYPLYDVAGYLGAAGYDPTSVDKYLTAHGVDITTRPECRRVVMGDPLTYTREVGSHYGAYASPVGVRDEVVNTPTTLVSVPLAAHHPVYDAVAAAVAYRRLRGDE
jgi:hypothetical protein